jgi:hypothetical protein
LDEIGRQWAILKPVLEQSTGSKRAMRWKNLRCR